MKLKVAIVIALLLVLGPPGLAGDGTSFGFKPRLRTNDDSAPIHVRSVTGDLKQGGITRAAIVLKQDVAVKTIRFGWYLREPSRHGAVIAHGQTSRVGVVGIRLGEQYTVDQLLVDFDEIREVLSETEGTRNGWVVELSVDEVVFENGSKWNRVVDG